MADVNLLTQLDIQSGGDGSPSVVTAGQTWRFKGFTPEAGGNPGDGTFYVDGVEGTYSIGDDVGTNDHPVINIDNSAKGLYEFEYYIPDCDFGTSIFLSNTICEACFAGEDASLDVCSTCDVAFNLFDKIPGGPAATGTWVQISGTDTLSPAGGYLGTLNFNGVTADTYVLEYQISTDCKSTMTITVSAAPNPGTNKTITLCDSGGLRNLQTDTGGATGSWSVNVLPPAGTFDPVNGTFDPAPGDADDWFTPTTYVFTKSVGVSGVDSQCEGECMATATVTANVYKLWRPGVDSLYNSICNDGVQTVDVADFMNDADPGGYWQFVGFIRESDNAFLSEIDMYIDGVLTTLDIFGDYPGVEIIEQDSFTLRVPSGTPTGEIRFWRRADTSNGASGPAAPCRSTGQISFNVISCGGTTCTSDPQISLATTSGGTCVNATLSGSYSNVQAITWTYRTSPSGSFNAYTAGTDICGQTYVEFRMVMSFSNGCPTVERSKVWTYSATCSNTPSVSASCGTCSITLTPGGTINSPIGSDVIQWRNYGTSTWQTYTGPISFSTSSKTIEYRRQVSFTDGCTSITTSTQQVTCNCTISSCAVSISASGSTLTAFVSSCNQSISYQWEYSANGSTGWVNLGTSQSQAANQGSGYYKVTVTCGAGNCTSTYQYTEGQTCQSNVTLTYSGGQLHANVTGCGAATITYAWQYSASGTGWTTATGSTNSATLTPQNGGGYYRVLIWCPTGQCPDSADYHLMATCNNTPTVTAVVNNTTCTITLTKTGTINSPINLDQIFWRPQGSSSYQSYTGPIPFSGVYDIEFYRAVSFTDGCPTVVDSDTATGDCQAGTCSVSIQFNGSLLVASGGCTGTWQWAYSANGSTGWTNLGTSSSQTPTQGNGYYRATLTCSGGSSCSQMYQIMTCNNSPGVYINLEDCRFSFTRSGSTNSPISTDVIQYREFGTSTWITYSSGYVNLTKAEYHVEYRRVVTYSDGCPTQIVGASTATSSEHTFASCTTICNVTVVIINGTTLQANVTGCSGSTITYQWAKSINGTTGWTNLGTASTQTLSGTGYYRVITNCGYACSDSDIYYFIDCDAFTASASHSCSTGIAYSLSGGTSPYTYSIAPGTILSTGTHSWTVTDANGCQRSGSISVNCCAGAANPSITSYASTWIDYRTWQVNIYTTGDDIVKFGSSSTSLADGKIHLNGLDGSYPGNTIYADVVPTFTKVATGHYRFTFQVPSNFYRIIGSYRICVYPTFQVYIGTACDKYDSISAFMFGTLSYSFVTPIESPFCTGSVAETSQTKCAYSAQSGIIISTAYAVITLTSGYTSAGRPKYDLTGKNLSAGTHINAGIRCLSFPSNTYLWMNYTTLTNDTC